MGYNTSMIVLNDALGSIEKDQEFGKKVAEAIRHLTLGRPNPFGLDISSGSDVNAASVIETHHADCTTVLAFGGNCASVLFDTFGYRHNEVDMQKRMLEEWANKLGYRLVKKKAQK